MREYLLVTIVAALVTFVMTPVIRWAAVRFGAVTPVRGRDVHSVPIPRLGGLAMLIGFAAAELIASRLPYLGQLFHSSSTSNSPGHLRELLGVLAGAAIITLIGAIDDFRDLDPLTKMAGCVIAAGVMTFSGVQMVMVPFAGTYTVFPLPILVALTMFIVIATTQAVNFADGLDGLAAGMVAIASIAFFWWVYSWSSYSDPTVFSPAAFITAATIGVCLGFLPHNFHPARLFMGDAGALLLGLLMSASTISFTGQLDPGTAPSAQSAQVAAWLPLALPMLILAVPVLDVILAFRRRGWRFWTADAKHLHHRMLAMGHPHRQAVLILYLWSASVAGGVLAFAYVPPLVAISILCGGVLLSLVLTFGLPNWSARRRL